MPDSSFILPSDLKAAYLDNRDQIRSAVHRVLESGWYIGGEEVEKFEEHFAEFVGVEHAIGTGTGTDAINLALRSLGIGPGDVVMTVSHTAVATVAAIELAGAVPRFVDVDPVTYTMDPDKLEAGIAELEFEPGALEALKAIIPVHIYGHPADMPRITRIARKYDLALIEDCAQAHGAAEAGTNVGTWGDMAIFSFYPTKNLGALGDGGVLVTDDSDLARKARLLKEYGWEERYISAVPGMNTRLDPLQAAILDVKLERLPADNARRGAIASAYDKAFRKTDLRLPSVRKRSSHVFHQYVVRHPRRDQLRQYLRSLNIGTLIHYPVPVHLQPAYKGRIPLPAKGLGITEKTCNEILSLPIYPQMTEEQIQRVVDGVCAWNRTH